MTSDNLMNTYKQNSCTRGLSSDPNIVIVLLLPELLLKLVNVTHTLLILTLQNKG